MGSRGCGWLPAMVPKPAWIVPLVPCLQNMLFEINYQLDCSIFPAWRVPERFLEPLPLRLESPSRRRFSIRKPARNNTWVDSHPEAPMQITILRRRQDGLKVRPHQ